MNEFERFVEDEKTKLAECLRGRIPVDENSPDMPGISDADGLKEQFEEFYLKHPCNDASIDWNALERELKAYAEEVTTEWLKRKKAEDRLEAIRAGRL
jgi:hypothetical protein